MNGDSFQRSWAAFKTIGSPLTKIGVLVAARALHYVQWTF